VDPTDSDHPYNRFCRELSTNLALVHTLLAEHPPTGPCRGCRLPGPDPAPEAPCSVRRLALLALSLRLHADADEVAR
jgi:hypothetical protein